MSNNCFDDIFLPSHKVNEKRHKDGDFQRQEHLSRRNKEIPRWIVELNHQRTRIACRLVGSYVKKSHFSGGYGEDANNSKM